MAKMASLAEAMREYPDAYGWTLCDGVINVFDTTGELVDSFIWKVK
jgi:hypothetical protein